MEKYINFIKHLGFTLQDGQSNVYAKSYNGYKIQCDFDKNAINYGDKITCERKTTCNFNQEENLVVLECVNRLLTIGYKPECIILEKSYGSGRKAKGQFLDILITREDKTAFALIECKTFGNEHNKERIKTQTNGGQLFNYFVNQKDADFLVLYSSSIDSTARYVSDIIITDDTLKESPDTKTMYSKWGKVMEVNGFFENSSPYHFNPQGVKKRDLKDISYADVYSTDKSKITGTIYNRFAEILRRHTISDKSNAYNKIFNLFLCKIIDEQNTNKEEYLQFQWNIKDTAEDVVGRLSELYKKGMDKYMSLDVTDHTEEEFLEALQRADRPEAIKMFKEIRLFKNNEFAFKEVINEKTFKQNAAVIKEVVKLLEGYRIKYSHKHQFLGDFFERLLSIGIKQEAGQFFTPIPIARFIVNSIPFEKIIDKKIQNKEKDYLPFCIDYACGSGHFLTEAMDRIQKVVDDLDADILSPEQKKDLRYWKTDKETKDAYYWASTFIYGIEKDYRLAKTTKISCFLNGDGEANILYADGLNKFGHTDYKVKDKPCTQLLQKEQFDVVIANPPFSVEGFKETLPDREQDFTLSKHLGESSDDIECLFIERTVQLLREGGICGIIVPSTILTNGGIHSKARKLLIENFELIGIQELHGGVFIATGNSTVVLFGKKRNTNATLNRVSKVLNTFTEQWQDINFNQNEGIISQYCKIRGFSFDEYINKLQHSKKLQQTELERLKFFLLTYNQNIIVSFCPHGSGKVKDEKLFLGFKHSDRKKYEGIKPFPNNKTGHINSKLYTDKNPLDETKISSYIYKYFLGEKITNIDENLKDNLYATTLEKLINWEEIKYSTNKTTKETIQKDVFTLYINTNKARQKEEIKWKYEAVKLVDLDDGKIQIVGGVSAPQESEYFTEGNIPFVRAGSLNNKDGNFVNISSCDMLNQLGMKTLQLSLTPKNTIVFPVSGKSVNTNNIALLPQDSIIVNHLIGLFVKNGILNKYVFYFLQFYKTSNLSMGGSYPSIDSNILKSFKIPLPPKEIQKQIVNEIEAIEQKTGKIEREITKLDEEEVDCIYGNEVMLEELVDFQSGYSFNSNDFEMYRTSENMPVVKIANITADCKLNLDGCQFHKYNEKFKQFLIQENDILIAMTGATVGKIAQNKNTKPLLLNQRVGILRTKEVNPMLLFTSLKHSGIYDLCQRKATGSNDNVSDKDILQFKVTLPPLEEQQKIVSQIEEIETKIEQLKTDLGILKKDKSKVLDKYLLDKIL